MTLSPRLLFILATLCLLFSFPEYASATPIPPKINPSSSHHQLPYHQGPCLSSYHDTSIPCSLSLTAKERPLPVILSPSDKNLYRSLFLIQEKGEWKRANLLIKKLRNPILMGHVLYQRYMHPRLYRSSFKELQNWLTLYRDHPGNLAIQKLALKRRPHKTSHVPRLLHPVPKHLRTSFSSPHRSPALSSHNKKAYRKIRSMVQNGYVTRALEYTQKLRSQKQLKNHAYALSLGAVARGYYRYHKWNDAITMARYLESLPLSSSFDLDAYWWAGLSAWRQERYTEAAEFFDKYASPLSQKSEAKARGYYWSALASLMAGYPKHSSPRLQLACQQSLEFYGYIACQALTLDNPHHHNTSLPHVPNHTWAQTLKLPSVKRALALMEVGNIKKAISELRPLTSRYVSPKLLKTLTHIASSAHLPHISYLAARSLFTVTGEAYLQALFPQPMWTPLEGYNIDRAVVYAIIRQESHFNPFAKSRRQARGLMQLIPSTARFISRHYKKPHNHKNLYQPALNIQLGQSYVQWLLSTPKIEGNLLNTLVAYNGGPGNMASWQKRIADTSHPLLYIESLPPRETRNYVRNVLRNLWFYRNTMKQEPTSLHALLKSLWPSYIPQDPLLNNPHPQASALNP